MDLQPALVLALRGGHARTDVLADEIRRAGGVQQFARNRRLDAAVAAQRHHLIEKVAWMARAERTPERRVVPALEIRDHHLMEPQVAPLAVQLEDPHELLERRIADGDLVRDAAEKSFVG